MTCMVPFWIIVITAGLSVGCAGRQAVHAPTLIPDPVVTTESVPAMQPVSPAPPAPMDLDVVLADFLASIPGGAKTIQCAPSSEILYYRDIDDPCSVIPQTMDAAMAELRNAQLASRLPGKELIRPPLIITVLLEPDRPDTKVPEWPCFYASRVGEPWEVELLKQSPDDPVCLWGWTQSWKHPPMVYIAEYRHLKHEYQHLAAFANYPGLTCTEPDGRVRRVSTAIGHGGDCDPLRVVE